VQLRNPINRLFLFRALAVAAALTVAALALAGCGGGPGSTSPSGGAPLKIGISLSLTGDFSDSGKAAQRGYELWASVVNKSGGVLDRQVQLSIVDDASSPDQVVTNYTNLITQDKVDIVFGPFSSLLTVPASRVVNRYRYSFIEPAGGGPLGVRAEARQPVLRAARADHLGRRRLRRLHPVAARGPATQDGGIRQA